MSPNFLDQLPLEIRIQIYLYVLACPSGSLNFFSWIYDPAYLRFQKIPADPVENTIVGKEGIFDLSLLKTCKQIRRECKEIIWEHNGLRLTQPSKLFLRLQRYCDSRKIRTVQHITIQLEVLDRDELEWMSKSLKALVDLVSHGSLESIRLMTTRHKKLRAARYDDLSNLRKKGQIMDGRWYRAASISGHDSLPGKTFMINTGWPRFSLSGNQNWLRGMLLDSSQIHEILGDIHQIFGGELVVDGVLFYREGMAVAESIVLNPWEGEIRIRPQK